MSRHARAGAAPSTGQPSRPLRCVLFLTLVALGVSVTLSVMFPAPSEPVRRVIDVCITAFQVGFGAFVGMLTAGQKLR
jgi:hypothetical protein